MTANPAFIQSTEFSQRIYAGVLGKLIGVYLGRPIEGWTHARILQELGEVWYYVHERLNKPLVVTDDDISGTFTFLRALQDYLEDHTAQGDARSLLAGFKPRHIGQSWLNYIIENRAVLWWGGMSHSTEQTAYIRLKSGIEAPASGSIAMNGHAVAEQIGAQIFIDGWGMVSAGDPELAADLARRAASVSHDGEAIHAAQVVAALVAGAFVERDLGKLLDIAAGLIPPDSVIYRMIADLRQARAGACTGDWKQAFATVLQAKYGYERFCGNCHVVPNHGVIILALLYADDDFQKSLMIANTCGWDTDCNSGNVGCIMGVKNGLAGINAGPDWRKPIADRLYLPTADGGRFCSDAVFESAQIVRLARALASGPITAAEPAPRYDFSMPGSLQGWFVDPRPESQGAAEIANAGDQGGLAISFSQLAAGRVARAAVETFPPPALFARPNYAAIACPAIYPGQTIRARLSLVEGNDVTARLYLRYFGAGDQLVQVDGPPVLLKSAAQNVEWQVPPLPCGPIGEVGVELSSRHPASGQCVLHSFTWDGCPEVTFARPDIAQATSWKQAWVPGVDRPFFRETGASFLVLHSRGRGLLIQGQRQWTDYRAETVLTPHLSLAAGLAVRVQGMERYYAILFTADGNIQLVKCRHDQTILAEKNIGWQREQRYLVTLQVKGDHLLASVDGNEVFNLADPNGPLLGGGVGLVVEEGALTADYVQIGRVD